MDQNLNLLIGLKGQIDVQAQAVPMQEGYLKLPGIAGGSGLLKFGVVVSSDPDAPETFLPGCASGDVVRGVCVFDDAVAQNAIAHPTGYLTGFPAAAINHGFFYLGKWGKTATDAIDPVLGCKIIFKDATGDIEFVAGSTASAPSNWTFLANAQVRAVDDANGALIYIE